MNRHLGHAQLARRQHPSVAGNNHAVGPDQNRVDEPELHDRCRDLSHLSLRMRARVRVNGSKSPIGRSSMLVGSFIVCNGLGE